MPVERFLTHPWRAAALATVLALGLPAMAAPVGEPESVVRELFQDLRVGRTYTWLRALAPMAPAPGGHRGWTDALEALTGSRMVQLEAFRPDYWEPGDREYLVHLRPASGSEQVYVLGLRLESEGWRVQGLSNRNGPRLMVRPAALKPGVAATVQATGYPPRTRVDLQLIPEGGRAALLAQLVTDARGELASSFEPPASLQGLPLLKPRVTVRLGTPDGRLMAERQRAFQPTLFPRDLGAVYRGKGYSLAFPAGFWRKTLPDGVSWVEPGLGEVVRLREIPLPLAAKALDPEEFAHQYGPLMIDGAGETLSFDRYRLEDGSPAWAATWEAREDLLPPYRKGIPLPPRFGPTFLIPRDRMGERWLVLESSGSYTPVLEAMARSVLLGN